MVRLFLGNLDQRVTEGMIQGLFEQQGLQITNIQVKSTYAFVDCADQETADRAIDSLNGYNLMGVDMQVEPSVSKRRRSNRVVVHNVPSHSTEDDISSVFGNYGAVKEISKGRDESVVLVTYMSPEQAQQAVERLNGSEFLGAQLTVEFGGNGGRPRGPPSGSGGPGPRRPQMGPYRREEFPLRISVPSDTVGAIIGREGKTIKTITQQSKARVDVLRRDNSGSAEKMIVILANQPENCTEACREILRVISQEAQNTNRGDISLKILAHNNLCGRLIGKGGNVLKSIMEETDTKIGVSSIHDVTPFNQDRVIEVRGSIDDMVQAQDKIYGKLKTAYENDLRNYKMDPSQIYPQMNMNMMAANMMGYGMVRPPYNNMGAYGIPGLNQQTPPPQGGGPGNQQLQPGIVLQVYVPSSSVGALIGTKGSYINFVKDQSRASVSVESKDQAGDATERVVTIKGFPEAAWKAEWYVFDKIKSEGFMGGEDPRLKVEFFVPKSMVGRIIGKQGQNVRTIQHVSGTIIKLPEDQGNQGEEVPVQIIGNIYTQTIAQALIRQLLSQGTIPQPGGPRGRGRGGGPPRQGQNGQ